MIEDIKTIVQGIQTQAYNLEGMAKYNAVLTIPNSAAMAQLAQMPVTINDMQAQLKYSPQHKTTKRGQK